MALLNNAPKAIYLTIQGGKIAHRQHEATATSKMRQTESGKIIHEELFDSVEGKITDITFRDSDYGRQVQIHITNDGEAAILQMPFSSGVASAFFKMLPNVKADAPVRIIPKMEEKDGKRKTSLFINQGGPVKWAYTKDNPGDLPSLKKVKVKGKDTWDDSDQLEYFEKYVTNVFLPKIKVKTNEVMPSDDIDTEEAPF